MHRFHAQDVLLQRICSTLAMVRNRPQVLSKVRPEPLLNHCKVFDDVLQLLLPVVVKYLIGGTLQLFEIAVDFVTV